MFLYHCHNLPHEDMGMMRNYEVMVDPTGDAPVSGPPEDGLRLELPAVWTGSGPLAIRCSAGHGGGPARLRVFEVTGREVRALNLRARAHGELTSLWDLRNESGLRSASGVYLVRLEGGSRALTRRVTLVR
jgi:hypothetical protein